MAYVNVPNDLSKVKTKMAFNLTKRQLICFGSAAVIGIPAYLFTRAAIGNTGAMLLMIVLMLPCFLLAMYERDGLPFEKVLRNIIRSTFLWPRVRPYKTANIYAYLSSRKEVSQLEKRKKTPTRKKPGA
ncbi:conjugative transposon membrane protein [Clostridioides difficile]|uniref:PrgI family protein n=1 Tax=Clostridioides difficile TaxID=1496 RepID=UPI000E4FA4F0|nr:PrgI family protein [Clostridioides difficile]AXU75645.1 conjugative transposon membrane protein [Clostridioides difficile]MDI3115419.1 PrgI family protein [Clostridioides difficile]MDK3180655.1 PrgI family protein [Clostridioides difficile]HBF0842426.1 PrgI family protein [Clostridioides difficile]